ncbi:DUF3592 domain-containing protein [Streptomyces sp. PmtG]
MRIRTRGRDARWWLMFSMLTVGTLCLVAGLVFTWVSASFLMDAERVQGKVVALEGRGGGDVGPVDDTAYPVVEFRSADGAVHTFRDSAGSSPPAYEVGERVEVLYHADSPGDARIKGFLSLWLLPVILGGIGLIFTGIGTAFALVARRRSSYS